jgi:hypothetical protein
MTPITPEANGWGRARVAASAKSRLAGRYRSWRGRQNAAGERAMSTLEAYIRLNVTKS